MAAFEASLPTLEQNEAGRRLVTVFRQFRAEVDSTTITAEDRWSWRAILAIDKGQWPINDADLNDQMDAFAAGPWLPELRAATALPLGMVDGLRPPLYEMDVQLNVPANMLGRLCVARAMQLAARKQPAEAFDSFFLALDFSRQLRNKANHTTYLQSASIERTALRNCHAAIESAATKPYLIADALARLTAYQRSVLPPMTDTLKLDFMNIFSIGDRGLVWLRRRRGETLPFAADSPLEALRTRAIRDTLLAGYLRTTELDLSRSDPPHRNRATRMGLRALEHRLGVDSAARQRCGDAGRVSADGRTRREFRILAQQGRTLEWSVLYQDIFMRTARSAGRLQLSLALYQLRHGRPATTLSELVPEFISELPNDPYSEKPLGYRVSSGERLDWSPGCPRLDAYRNIEAGTGIVWSVGGDMVDGGGRINDAFLWHYRNDSPERRPALPRAPTRQAVAELVRVRTRGGQIRSLTTSATTLEPPRRF